jgi:uncharacterized protein (TIGR02145 family)
MPTNQSTFTDIRDGHIYKTVEIGEQVWMAENLNYYAEGLRQYKEYENDCKYGNMYGLLYDWKTATKVCPGGWHLPSNEEWLTLINFVGGEKIAGKELKAKNGFAALPGGYYHPIKGFNDVGNFGYWWSSSEIHENRAFYYYMNYNGDGIGCYGYSKMSMYSVRCIKN